MEEPPANAGGMTRRSAPLDFLDALSAGSLVLVLVGQQTRFDRKYWWIGPLAVMAIGESLRRRGRILGLPVIALGLFLFVKAYREYERDQRTTATFVPDAGDAWAAQQGQTWTEPDWMLGMERSTVG